MTMRSNGNSKIIGAATAPIAALPSATRQPCELPTIKMMTKMTATHRAVTGVMGSAGAA
jgi:hypothetical protein